MNAGLAGRYTIECEIGSGGMAMVFLARDLRHQRAVALKLLRPELASVVGAERFLSEIRVTAHLQHPNLLPLFDSGESDGLLYYVMPFVDGESLRQRLDREKQLPVDEAVRIAVAICAALDYAHRHGVIHRDLKPENILLHEGQPVIADFGIALAVSRAGGGRLTLTGLSLGTPHYMSPEQAAGDRQIDARTDVYAAGAVTYEMLIGEPPHTGANAQAIIAKLLTDEPRLVGALRRSVSPHVEAAIHRALQKLPADRFATAHDLADALSGKAAIALPRSEAPARPGGLWKLATVGAAAVAVAAVVWGATRQDTIATNQALRFPLGLPDSAALDAPTFDRSIDLSPDGSTVAYVGANALFVRSLDNLTPRRLTSEPARDPRFSPDGAWVAYVSNFTLRKVPVVGGTPITIADSVARFGWGAAGTIVFTRSGPAIPELWRIDDGGGRLARIAHPRGIDATAYGAPSFFPDGDSFLLPVVTKGGGAPVIAVGRLSDATMRYLEQRGDHPLYASGVLLFIDASENVMAATFDARSLRMTGTPARVLQGVRKKASAAELAISANGTMVYLPGAVPRYLVEIDRTGHERPLPASPGLFGTPRYSPEGRRIALAIGQPLTDIWIYEIGPSTMRRLTNNAGAGAPEWTADGRRVGWTQIEGALGLRAADLARFGTYWRAADGSDSATALLPSGLGMAFSPTGGFGVSVIVPRDGRAQLNVMQLDSTPRPRPIMETVGPPAARISPDGRWIAYVSSETGLPEIYVRAVAGFGAHYPISTGGGSEPVWNPRGRELFFRTGTQLVAATLTLEGEPRVVRRDTLPFSVPRTAGSPWATYDVSRDGAHFLFVKGAAASDQPIVIIAWLDEVRALLNARR